MFTVAVLQQQGNQHLQQMNMNNIQYNQLMQQTNSMNSGGGNNIFSQPPPTSAPPALPMPQMPPITSNISQVWSNCPPAQIQTVIPPPPAPPPNPLVPQIEAINVQQSTLREQIMQSEKNLQAQHSVITTPHSQLPLIRNCL